MSWASFLQFFSYSLCCYYLAFVVIKVLKSYSGTAVTDALHQKKPENFTRLLPGEECTIRHYGPMHTACRSKLHVSIAPVPRGPEQLHAALLLTQLGLMRVCILQFHPAPLHRTTLQQAPLRNKMPPRNSPEECSCCDNLGDENCEDERCNCICLHDIVAIAEQEGRAPAATSSAPPPPPPLQPPPTPVPSPARVIICLDDPVEDPLDTRPSAPNRGYTPPPRPPKPPPRDTSRSPRSRSRSRSPTPLVRTRTRRHSRETYREDSVSEAARRVANKVWRHAEQDRIALEEKLEQQARKLIAKFQIGHKEGVVAAQRLHNSYVLPQNLSQTFAAGFLACLAGILTGLLIMLNMRGFF